jgi:hypothetical protein
MSHARKSDVSAPEGKMDEQAEVGAAAKAAENGHTVLPAERARRLILKADMDVDGAAAPKRREKNTSRGWSGRVSKRKRSKANSIVFPVGKKERKLALRKRNR